jgi:hypothetical protein
LPPHYGWLGDGHHTNIYISYTNQLYASNIQLERRRRRRRKILQQSKVSDRQRGGGIEPEEEEEEDEGIYSRGYKAMMKLKDKTEGGCFFDLKRKEPPPLLRKRKNPEKISWKSLRCLTVEQKTEGGERSSRYISLSISI